MSFPHTRKALVQYYEDMKQVNDLFDTADTNYKIKLAVAKEKAAVCRVREASFKDTLHFNSRTNCMWASIDWMEQLVKAGK